MTERKKPLRWRRQPIERGLSSVCHGEHGWELRRGGETLAVVAVLYKGMSREKRGYYFWGNIKPRYTNTSDRVPPYATVDEAKAAAEAWVKQGEGDN